MTVSDDPADKDASLMLLFTWNGYSSFNRAPEYVIVEAFSMTDGSRLGAFPVPRQTDPCGAENTCTYTSSVSTAYFPPGEYMLVATDPLSGVSTRQAVALTFPGEGSRDFFRQFEQEQVFAIVSGVLAAFLLALLTILSGEEKR